MHIFRIMLFPCASSSSLGVTICGCRVWLGKVAPVGTAGVVNNGLIVQALVRSCVQQCEGTPQLLVLVDRAVRRTVPTADWDAVANTLSADYAKAWETCENRLLHHTSRAWEAGANRNAYDKQSHQVYEATLTQAMADVNARTVEMIQAALRTLMTLDSKQPYPLKVLKQSIAKEYTRSIGTESSGPQAFTSSVATSSFLGGAGLSTAVSPRPPSVSGSFDHGMQASDVHSLQIESIDGSLMPAGPHGLEVMLEQDRSIPDTIPLQQPGGKSPFDKRNDARDQQLLEDVAEAIQVLREHAVLEIADRRSSAHFASP